MSVQATTWAWEHSTAKGNDLLVLLAVADAANAQGGRSCQSAATVSSMTRLSERTVQRVLQRLVESGELVVDGRDRRYQTNVYSMPGVAAGGPVTLRQDDGPSNCRYDKTDPVVTTKQAGRYDTAVSPNPINPSTTPTNIYPPTADAAEVTLEGELLDVIDLVVVEHETPTGPAVDEPGYMPVVDELCEQLAEWVQTNTGKRPTVGKTWRRACRLMLEVDELSTDDVRGAIDWSQRHEFWRAHVMSMSKLRDKYPTLSLQAQRDVAPTSRSQARVADNLDLVHRIARGMA